MFPHLKMQNVFVENVKFYRKDIYSFRNKGNNGIAEFKMTLKLREKVGLIKDLYKKIYREAWKV